MLNVIVLGLRGIPDIQGGIETHCEQLYPKLVQHGCSIEIIGRSPFLKKKKSYYNNISIRRLYAPDPKYKGLEAFVNTFIGVLYAALRKPDILHIHAVGPALFVPLAKILGLKVIVTHHGFDYQREKWGNFAKKIIKWGEYLGMNFAHQRIVVSEEIKKHLKQTYGVESVKIPNGVKIETEKITENALKKFKLQKHRYILMVSRLVPEKRQEDLIKAFSIAKINGWKLVLVGDISQEDQYIKKMIHLSRKNPNIVLTGFQYGAMLKSLYANAGLFVLPSSHEGLPIVILEALSFGIPVIASDIKANLEVNLRRAFYFRLGDITQLKKKILETINTINQIDQRGLIEHAKQYSWDVIAKKTFDVYRQFDVKNNSYKFS
jgi:glycosyltransferase involved in cell wall biosynthesis